MIVDMALFPVKSGQDEEDHDALMKGLQVHLASEPVVYHVQPTASTSQANRSFA